MRKTVNECHECGECIGCGLKHKMRTFHVCDKCEEEETVYFDFGGEICEECLLAEHYEGEGFCMVCSTYGDLYDGLCHSCFMDDQQEVSDD